MGEAELHTLPTGTFVTIDESTLIHQNHPQLRGFHYSSLLVLYILWAWTNIKRHISTHHYDLI